MTDIQGKAPQAEGGCSCGKVRYGITGAPLFRARCHCRTCQAYNDAAFGDILVLRSRDVTLSGEDQIAFRFHQTPPVVRRGRCSSCDGVAVERIHLPLFPKLTILPAPTLDQPEDAPQLDFHMFYHRRREDVADALPKHSGYLSSQWAFAAGILKGLRKPSR